MGVFEKTIPLDESQALRLSEQPTPVKKKRRGTSYQKNVNLPLELEKNQSILSYIDR